MSLLEEALAYWDAGINIVPAPPGGKAPVGQWKRWQKERVPRRLVEQWFADESKKLNIYAITGAVSRLVVLDCDTPEVEDLWREYLGDAFETGCAKTRRGFHFHWRLPEGQECPKRKGKDWDLQGDGGGVIVPPSVHESGAVYEWQGAAGAREALGTFLVAPETLWLPRAGRGPQNGGTTRESFSEALVNAGVPGMSAPETLTSLLAAPPEGEGERHNWLASVAGHYAKQLLFQDAFNWHVEQAAIKLDPPLTDEAVENIKRNIWNKEAERHDHKLLAEIELQRRRRTARALLDEQEQEALWRPAPLTEWEQWLAQPDRPIEWTIQALHERGTNTLLTAEYKTGKTTLLLNLIRALVDDELFLGRWAARAERRVMLYDFESTETQLQRWAKAVGIRNKDRVRGVHLRGYPAGLMTTRGREQTIRTLKKHEVSDWILDPFGRALQGNENANDEVRAFLDNLNVIKREAGVDNMYIATHTGRVKHEKGKEHARGATTLDDDRDNGWWLTKDDQGNRYFRADGRSDTVIPESQLDYNVHTRILTIATEELGLASAHASEIETALLQRLTGRSYNRTGLRKEVYPKIGRRSVDCDAALERLVESGRVVQIPGDRPNEKVFTRARKNGQEVLR